MSVRQLISNIICLVAAGIALAAFFGQLIDNHPLAGWHAGKGTDMAFNTVACIFMLSTAIIIRRNGKPNS